MCERCDEIDRKIEEYSIFRSRVTDPLAFTLFGVVLEDLQSEKDALHPDEARSPD